MTVIPQVPSHLTFPALPSATSPRHFALHEAALDWDLADPIIIERAEDIKSRPNWQARGLTPFEQQIQNLMTFCRRLPVILLTDDVGLGKTISAGLILSKPMTRTPGACTRPGFNHVGAAVSISGNVTDPNCWSK